MKVTTVLVLGAHGKTGRRIAARLEDRGVRVRRGSRSTSPSFDWANRETWGPAVEGVDAAYVAYPQELDLSLATQRIGDFIDHARNAGVRRLVLLTGRGEEDGLDQEALLRSSGLEWTVVRSAWFAQNFTEGGFAALVDAGQFALPSGNVPEPFVDLEDLAEVAVAALLEVGHGGEVYEVTGPRGLTLQDVAAELSAATGRPLSFVPVTHDAFLEGLAAEGTPESVIGLMDFLFGTLLDGRNAHLGDGVQRALGRQPRDFREFARREMATPGNVNTLRAFVSRFINGGDESAVDTLVQPDYRYRSPGDEVHGREGLKAMFRGYRVAFPDLHLTVNQILAQGDQTVLDFTLSGTHQGDFMGLPASGRVFSINGFVRSTYRAGKIAEEWEVLDQLAMLQQLGAVPEGA